MTPSRFFRRKGFDLKALSPSLVYKSSLTKRNIFTWDKMSIFGSFLSGFFKSFYPGCNYFGGVTDNYWKQTACWLWRLLKIPAKMWHSFQYLNFFALFLHKFFCNFEVKIARFIKLYAQRERLMKCFLGFFG